VTTAEDTPKSITLVATDLNGDPLTYQIVTGPAHGLLSGTGANRTYSPVANYNGTDSFAFKANDGQRESNVATVSINVTPVADLPTFTMAANTSAEEPEGETNVFYFYFDDVDAQPNSAYTLDVTWGDGTSGRIANAVDWFGPGYTTYLIHISHVYKRFGNYPARLTLTDAGAGALVRTTTIKIADHWLNAGNSGRGTAIKGNVWAVRLVCLEDGNPYSLKTDLSATIQWGDGRSSAGTIKVGTAKDAYGGSCLGWDYGVFGSHTYTRTGVFNITIKVTSLGGSRATGTTSVKVQ
jgi:hypothetical protein